MILWTIQEIGAYEDLSKNGRLYGDWSRVDPDYIAAYKYMVDQMEVRGIPLYGKPPIWSWEKKPDLRHSAHLPTGTKGVRLKLSVPDKLTLFSEFGSWHYVLSDWYAAYSAEEFDRYFKLSREESEKEFGPDKRRESWSQVFKDYDGDTTHLSSKYLDYQVTIPYLDKEWVLSHQYFVAR